MGEFDGIDNKKSVMSTDLIWSCVRKNSSFLLKNQGACFTTEPNNLTARNSKKYSGLANRRTVDLKLAGKNIVVSTKSAKSSDIRKPKKAIKKLTLKKDMKRVAKSVTNTTHGYRPDLQQAALAKATNLMSAKRLAQAAKKSAKK